MKVLIDTNVILEYFMRREEYEVAERFLLQIHERNLKAYMTVGAFYTMHYIILRYLHKDRRLYGEECLRNLRSIMDRMLQLFDIAEHDKNSLLNAISDLHYKDLEDSCQYRAAVKVGCNYLVTFNTADYPVVKNAPVQVLTPQQYLDL